ncbi:Chaperone protein [Wickerhamomyces ciferrii]|uniref:Chaperone protein n=1 Tax=Wickerhamomyces ciferrii (strain ATCC 14091 / BCRC 22168 / CBS 111 / JCM 3599 / NBRC 0793 / NRRL Y-1031 F-60-10) TaxID=1206466 RepID=K0KGL3_WICCF|nr:Chaperone protein [Wickerhamomyces ciferrii]CCH42121.1 Chaperone protein [Wickerhamomyces ciferrii]
MTVLAWSVEDQEIFKIHHELQKDYPGTNFYEFFQLKQGPKSNWKEINRQFKKLSVKFHPDKVKGGSKTKKLALKNYERLSVIANILKGSGKERYDFFLKQGFPKYKNNQFLYERFKPGMIFTGVFLYLIIGIGHYVILKISTNQQKQRVETLLEQLKGYAIQQSSNGIITEPRKYKLENYELPFLVRIDGVFIIQDEDNQVLTRITTDDILTPRVQDSLLIKAPLWCWNQTFGRISSLKYEIKPQQVENHTEEPIQEPKKKKKPKGEKLVLPNGKVVYGKKSK